MISVTLITTEPSAKRSLFPGFTDWHSFAYEHPIFVSSGVLYPSQDVYSSGPAAYTMISWPASSSIGSWFLSIAVLTSGPLVSSSTAHVAFFSAHTLRKRSRTPWCASWSPWEKLNLATPIPASMSWPIVSSSQHLGPIVHTILVLRTVSDSVTTLSRPMRVEQKLMVCAPSYPVDLMRSTASSPMMYVLNAAWSTPLSLTMGFEPGRSMTITWSACSSPGCKSAMPSLRMVLITFGMSSFDVGTTPPFQRVSSSSRSIGTRPDTTFDCAATQGFVVTTTIGTGGLYLLRSVAGSIMSANTTSATAPMSRHAFTALDAVASSGLTGLGVLFQMFWYVMSPSRPSSAFCAMAAIVATAFAGNAPFAVSPDSIVASAPSNTMFELSMSISARVGEGYRTSTRASASRR